VTICKKLYGAIYSISIIAAAAAVAAPAAFSGNDRINSGSAAGIITLAVWGIAIISTVRVWRGIINSGNQADDPEEQKKMDQWSR